MHERGKGLAACETSSGLRKLLNNENFPDYGSSHCNVTLSDLPKLKVMISFYLHELFLCNVSTQLIWLLILLINARVMYTYVHRGDEPSLRCLIAHFIIAKFESNPLRAAKEN